MLKLIHRFSRIQIYRDVLYFYLLSLVTLCLREFPVQAEHKNPPPSDTRLRVITALLDAQTRSSESSEEGVIHSGCVF